MPVLSCNIARIIATFFTSFLQQNGYIQRRNYIGSPQFGPPVFDPPTPFWPPALSRWRGLTSPLKIKKKYEAGILLAYWANHRQAKFCSQWHLMKTSVQGRVSELALWLRLFCQSWIQNLWYFVVRDRISIRSEPYHNIQQEPEAVL